jgi:hypothetical protein
MRANFGAGALCSEHPLDARTCGIALSFPGGDLGDEPFRLGNAAVEALAAQHIDLDLHHVEPASVHLGCNGTPAGAAGGALRARERLHRACRAKGSTGYRARPDLLSLRIVHIDELAHTLSVVAPCPAR